MAGQSREFPTAATDALAKGHKIEAIKILRQEWGLGLKEAKDTVDTYVKARPNLASQFQEASTGNKRLWLWLPALLTAILLSYRFLHR
jgi:ribosomal protein L7/L12